VDGSARWVKLSVVIPAHNEEELVEATLVGLVDALEERAIDYEIVVVDDGSTDATASVVAAAFGDNARVRCVPSHLPRGFGCAVRSGLELFSGDAVAIVMADGSDAPEDVVRYYDVLDQGYDCAFGSRFIRGATVSDYPRFKLTLNRIVNWGIRVLFRHGYNDTTNVFKAYRRSVIETVQPLLSHHFNLTVELPLKAIVRGHSYAVVPISWTGRKAGIAKLKLQEMGGRYLFIVLYVFLEHHLSRGDYRPANVQRRGRLRPGLIDRAG
jgi:dolichol-phosphate mannosyltransferase